VIAHTAPNGQGVPVRLRRAGMKAALAALPLLQAAAVLLVPDARGHGWQAVLLAGAYAAMVILLLLSMAVPRRPSGRQPVTLAFFGIGLAAVASGVFLENGFPLALLLGVAAAVAHWPLIRKGGRFLLTGGLWMGLIVALELASFWPRMAVPRWVGVCLAASGAAFLLALAVHVGIVRDLSAAEGADAALENSEKRLRLITDNMADTISLLDARGVYLYVSPSLQKVFGHSPGDLMGAQALDNVHSEDVEPLRQAIRRSGEEGLSTVTVEYRFRHADGRYTWVESNFQRLRGPEGESAGFVAASRDIENRKQAEEALRLTIKVLEAGPAVVFRWRAAPGWPVELVTENVARYGYSASELLSGAVTYSALVHPEDLDAVAREVGGHDAAGRDAFHQEYRLVTRTGGVRLVSDYTVAERDHTGRVVRYQGIVVDITANRETEQALRASQEKLSRFFYTSPDAVDIARLEDGRYFEINSGFTAITGYTAEEAIGKTSLELGVWVEGGERAELVREMRQMGQVVNREVRFRRKNGEIGTGLTSASLLEVGGEICLLSITKDITERKALEEEHTERRLFLERVLENAPDAIVTVDTGHRVLDWNAGAQQLFGFSPTEARGKLLGEMLTGDDATAREQSFQWRRTADAGRRVAPTKTVRYRKDGAPVHVITSASPVMSGDRWLETVVIYTDVTAIHSAQEEIRNLNEELEERVRQRTAELTAANRELEAFAYSVSHDLRAPLRGIDGFSQALQEDFAPSLPDAAREHIQRIRSATLRMKDLIDGILALSRITRAEMKVERLDLADMARQVAAELAQRNPGRTVEVRIPATLPACGDRRLIRAALENLLDNGWKFTSRREASLIELTAEARGAETAYCMRDNGAGFDMEYAGKLFGPFQRLHRAEDFPGVGLGLANVQRIIHRHGGRVWAEGKEGVGAAFWFTLPCGTEEGSQ
jgi:PAS domain S-box-containing protein